jgi:hypothetical protein
VIELVKRVLFEELGGWWWCREHQVFVIIGRRAEVVVRGVRFVIVVSSEVDAVNASQFDMLRRLPIIFIISCLMKFTRTLVVSHSEIQNSIFLFLFR